MPSALPNVPLSLDSERVLALAARSLFDTLVRTAQGALVVDREHRIVWISDGYRRFLPALGVTEQEFVGRRIDEVVPGTLMAQVVDSGQPILVDLLTNRAGTFLVSRLPLRDEAGEVIGAVGMVLLDAPDGSMQPLLAKFGRLQANLDAAQRQLAEQRRPKHAISAFIGGSAAALEVKRQARRVAQTDSTVLLLGETGTGKELLAHGIHAASRRSNAPFIGINIAAVPDGLLEAEFFGVAPGAYTGADRRGRDGKFKLAHGGTLFLDEIGDMPLALQSKLLRALQEREIEPLGSNRVERVDVRIIAATSRDLAAMVADGSFRADLYYRLHVLPIRLPPLRERLEDLETLVDGLTEDIARRSGLAPKTVSREALALLAQQPWPGNIRELRNVLEQAALMTDDDELLPSHFASALDLGRVGLRLPAPRGTMAPAGGDDAARVAAMPAAAAGRRGDEAAQDGGAGGRPSAQGGASPAAEPTAPDVPARSVVDALSPSPLPELLQPLHEQVRALERRALQAALQATGGNRVAAARLLKISRACLYDRLSRFPELEHWR